MFKIFYYTISDVYTILDLFYKKRLKGIIKIPFNLFLVGEGGFEPPKQVATDLQKKMNDAILCQVIPLKFQQKSVHKVLK